MVLLTSMGVRTDHPDFAKAAFASCLTKPIKPAQLHEVLVRVLSGAQPSLKPALPPSKLGPSLATRFPLRILLCDDNVINQKVAMRLVQQMGYKADLAVNGIEALHALDRQPYDLIFMDVMMPEMSGLEATRAIRERQGLPKKHPTYKPNIIIVAMTASAMRGDREKCLASGMDDYLAKPVRLDDIRGIIERWGAIAARNERPEPNETDSTISTLGGPAPPDAPPSGGAPSAPVETDRLRDLTDDDPRHVRELVTLYLDQTSAQLVQLESSVRCRNAAEIRRLAHSCAGASATCGVRRLVLLLRTLEKKGAEAQLDGSTDLYKEIATEFDCVRHFLNAYMAARTGLVSPSTP